MEEEKEVVDEKKAEKSEYAGEAQESVKEFKFEVAIDEEED